GTPIDGAIGDTGDRRRSWSTAPPVELGGWGAGENACGASDSECQVPELRSTERSATLAIGDDGGRPLRRSNWSGCGAGVNACGVGDSGCQVPELRSTERSATLAIGDTGDRRRGWSAIMMGSGSAGFTGKSLFVESAIMKFAL